MKTLLSTVLLTAALITAPVVKAEVFVVVATSNPLRSLSVKEIQALYMGRDQTYPSGDYALALDLPRGNSTREEFYRIVAGMTTAQVNSYWARLIFTGRVMPPQTVPNEQIMLDQVRRNPSALGYLSKEPNDANLRTVLVIR